MISDGMPLRNITYKQIFFLIKLIAAIIIFYICLNYAVLPVGENFFGLMQKDYLDLGVKIEPLTTGNLVNQYIQEGIQEITNESSAATSQEHFAAGTSDNVYKNKFTTICNSNSTLCNLINWVGDYTQQDKYLYISSIYSVINFIQEHRVIGDDIVSVLHAITVDNSL